MHGRPSRLNSRPLKTAATRLLPVPNPRGIDHQSREGSEPVQIEEETTNGNWLTATPRRFAQPLPICQAKLHHRRFAEGNFRRSSFSSLSTVVLQHVQLITCEMTF
jgi:hypothetical protein